jgi:hypothetical protein
VSHDVFDDDQLSAMKRAIDQIMQATGDSANWSRHEVAHAVFVAACEDGEFDPTKLATLGLGLPPLFPWGFWHCFMPLGLM